MQYAGGLVKHLGLSMYRGAVPALAELIANAWDADSPKVELEIPFDTGLKDKTIVVRDHGRGMTWDDVQTGYLVVGRDKRKAEGEKSPAGRLLMGRKGLGKLAGFGIAGVVEVRTVRDRHLTHFAMHFADMTKGGEAEMVEPYEPTVLDDRDSDEPNGTTVILSDLQLTRAIVKDQFRAAMARRFSILRSGFAVLINGEPLDSYDAELQAVGKRDTPAERALRSELHRRGLRLRVDKAPLPGLRRRADVVFGPAKVAVFVDGCFWHGCPLHATWPKAHAAWWKQKIQRNRQRDAETDHQLAEAGWLVVRAWEHDAPVEIARRVIAAVRKRKQTMRVAARLRESQT